jgi:hypothetical protein
MEKGFYHYTLGYWQAIKQPSAETFAAYPEGTIQVPLMPGPGYTFSGSSWIAPSQVWLDEQAAKNVRSERLRRLAREVDPIASNALRWNALTAEKQTEWQAYRTALLNIPEQPGFPRNVIWPTPPQ